MDLWRSGSLEDFIRLFWTQLGDHRKRFFMICNSFSRAPDKPNKFRVIIPRRSSKPFMISLWIA